MISSSSKRVSTTASSTTTARNTATANRRKKRAVKGGARSVGTRGNLKGPPLRVLAARSPRPSARSSNKMAVLNDVSRLYKTPKQQRKPSTQPQVPSKNYKSKKRANKAKRAGTPSLANHDLTLRYQEEEFERLQAERSSLEQQYSALKRTMGSMDDAGAAGVGYGLLLDSTEEGVLATMVAAEMQGEAGGASSYFYHAGGKGSGMEAATSAADMIMSSPSVQPRREQPRREQQQQQQQQTYQSYQPYQPYSLHYGINNQGLGDGRATQQQPTLHDNDAFPMFADGHLEYPTMSGFEPGMAGSRQDGSAAAHAMTGAGAEPAETMLTPRFRSRSGLSHDSDAWRRMSERRPRTAPPKGLDSESAVWSNQQQNAIFSNQSYMVGEPTPRPQRGGQTNVSTWVGSLVRAGQPPQCLVFCIFLSLIADLILFTHKK